MVNSDGESVWLRKSVQGRFGKSAWRDFFYKLIEALAVTPLFSFACSPLVLALLLCCEEEEAAAALLCYRCCCVKRRSQPQPSPSLGEVFSSQHFCQSRVRLFVGLGFWLNCLIDRSLFVFEERNPNLKKETVMAIPAFMSFKPTNEELVLFLEHKAAGGTGIPSYVIPEVDLYSHLPPWDIFPHTPPEQAYLDQHWFCLTPLKTKSPKTGCKMVDRSLSLPGYTWHGTQKPEHLLPTLTKKVFNFLLPKTSTSQDIKSRRTPWSMHEYTLPHHPHLAICKLILRHLNNPPSTPHPIQICPLDYYLARLPTYASTSSSTPHHHISPTLVSPPQLASDHAMPPATSTLTSHDDMDMAPATSTLPQSPSSIDDGEDEDFDVDYYARFLEDHLSNDDMAPPTPQVSDDDTTPATSTLPQTSHDDMDMAPATSTLPLPQSSSSIDDDQHYAPFQLSDDHAFDLGFQNALMS